MPNYAVESNKQPMIATGIVEEIKEWEDKPGGGRRPSDRQARDEATGMPLWGVEVLYQQSAFGRISAVTAKVEIGAQDLPHVAPLTPVTFINLSVDVRANKTGNLIENWRADSLVDSTSKVSAGTTKAAA
ncbi:MAG: hypothetical protein NTZ03_02500 [Actinobacteria bacterium]|nr:hypothetical protein [Actinomycetota bacterium]